MEIVKDFIAYQIAKGQNYKIGDKIVFGKDTENGQFQRVANGKYTIDGSRPPEYLFPLKQVLSTFSYTNALTKNLIFCIFVWYTWQVKI